VSVASNFAFAPGVERYRPDAWTRFFAPPAVTVIGVSPNVPSSLSLMRNLRRPEAPFAGKVHLIHPHRAEVLGVPCLPSPQEVDGPLGIVFFFTPAAETLAVLEELPSRPDGVVIYAGGFKESGNVEGEQRLALWAASNGVPVLGPQSVGIAAPARGLLATSLPIPETFAAGPVGLLSSSGGILSAVIRSIFQRGLGVGFAMSWGNGAAVSFGDLALTVLRQPEVRVLAAYLESVESLEELAVVGRAAEEHDTPVVILPGGTSDVGSRAGMSHTGALATPWNVVRGVADQYGLLLAADPVELLWAVEALVESGFRRAPAGGVGIFSVSAGSAITIADAASELGVPLPELSPTTRQALGAEAGVDNPLDIGARAISQPNLYREKVRAFAGDPALGIVARVAGVGLPDESYPFHMSTGSIFIEEVDAAGKIPVLCAPAWQERAGTLSWPGTVRATGARETAVKLRTLSRWCGRDARAAHCDAVAQVGARHRLIEHGSVTANVVSGPEAQTALRDLPIAWPRQMLANTIEEAGTAATEIGFPIALKSERGLAHRAAAGAVLTGLEDLSTVRAAAAYLLARFGPPVSVNEQIRHSGEELVLGLESAGTLGGLLMFGRGGLGVGSDVQFRLIPLEPQHRRELLAAYVAEPLEPLARLLAMTEELFTSDPRIVTLEFNPLVVTPTTGDPTALDAKIHYREKTENGGRADP
jgi:acyl-CoA synthetase (NDP forming)